MKQNNSVYSADGKTAEIVKELCFRTERAVVASVVHALGQN